MAFQQQPQLPLLTCDQATDPRICKGFWAASIVDNQLVVLDDSFSLFDIRYRAAERYLNMFRIIGALVGVVGFFGVFALYYLSDPAAGSMMSLSFWFDSGPSYRLFFWFSFLLIGYLLYRLIVGNMPQRAMSYAQQEKLSAPLAMPSSWGDVHRVPKDAKTELAAYLSKDAKKAIEDAVRLAASQKSGHVELMHVFVSLLGVSSIASLFVRLGLPPKQMSKQIRDMLRTGVDGSDPRFSSDVYQTIFHAYRTAREEQQSVIHATELLLATVMQSERLQIMLYDLNVDHQKLHNVITWIRIREELRQEYQKLRVAGSRRSKYGLDKAMTAVATPFLNTLGHDLTMDAKYGALPPCVARDDEMNQLFRIVEAGQQQVLLVGPHGVGKMAIVEGLAQRMVRELVPERLSDKRLVQVSPTALLTGATIDVAQERLARVMREVGHAKNIILFINNIHDLMGSGDGPGLNVAESLAEYLSSTGALVIATTTPDAYNRHVANTELASMFSRMDVSELEHNSAVQVLESKVPQIEYKHRVFFSYDAIDQAVELADRFITDQYLPESAMGILTESASLVRHQKGENALVSPNDVAQVISSKTGIQATAITEEESDKLLNLEAAMHQYVIGQDEAVTLVANALRRARADIRAGDRPIANFLFLGPTGVGKTELAKTIARVYFGGANQMIRVDMSEYQDVSGIYRLIGQAGQQGTGFLTEAVHQKPFSLVLLDELEKAHSDILNLFLQVFDDGRLTDSTGRVIDFTNTIIIATSNAATSYLQKHLSAGEALEDIRQQLIRGKLQEYYRPEFLNRFDGVVLFKPLEKEEIIQIAGLMLERIGKTLYEERGVTLRVDGGALEYLARIGYDPEFGARPMRRAIQDVVENGLAELVISGTLSRRDTIILQSDGTLRVESV